MTAKRVPLGGGGLPRTRSPMSSIVSPMAMSAGVRSVHQTRVETVPGPGCFALVAGESISTLATFFESCPVTTRRIGG